MSGDKRIFRRAVTETSLTESDLGTVGEYRQDGDVLYKLVKASTTIKDGGLAQLASFSHEVIEHADAGLAGVGFNNTGATVPANGYYFAVVRGPCYAECGSADCTANTNLSGDGSGNVADITGSVAHVVGYTVAAVASSDAASDGLIYALCE